MAARGEQVSSLVSAMQNGTISKSELFVSLSELQRSSTSPPKNPSSDANRVQTLVGAMREGKLSKAELMASLSSLRSESRAAHVDEPRAPRRGGTPPRGAWDDAAPARAETDDAPQQPPPPPSPRAWGSNASHPRARARLSEDDECTLRPKVKKLPAKLYASANRSAGSFLERTDRWASERDANTEAPRATSAYARKPVKSRYRAPTKASAKDEPPPGCTFRPAIANGFRPEITGVKRDMKSAKTYAAANVFERLARPLAAKPVEVVEDEEVEENATVDSRSSAKGWDSFLRRQAACDARRAKKVAAIRKSESPAFKPDLRRTARAKEGDATDGFMERLVVAARRRERRELDTMEKASSNGDLDECTFRPAIKTAARPRRSCAELSQGDALRRETNRRLLMLKTEREERKKHSFKPTLETATSAESKLRIHSQPESYLDRLRDEDAGGSTSPPCCETFRCWEYMAEQQPALELPGLQQPALELPGLTCTSCIAAGETCSRDIISGTPCCTGYIAARATAPRAVRVQQSRGQQQKFDLRDGVIWSTVGYTSGTTPAPNYDDLGDHTEALRLEFDEDVVSYEALVEQFWDLHAPNKGSRQYRSAIFYHDEAQRECAERVQAQLFPSKRYVRDTAIEPAAEFFPAEAYHQKYREKLAEDPLPFPFSLFSR
ncbi:peptide-methionine (S)-S-oxide reductase [Aureococcus anophagefferens]|nr:peptide-methionine (S)-S-oxide reductase [Aureococcus anophagefferens]